MGTGPGQGVRWPTQMDAELVVLLVRPHEQGGHGGADARGGEGGWPEAARMAGSEQIRVGRIHSRRWEATLARWSSSGAGVKLQANLAFLSRERGATMRDTEREN